MSTKKTLVFIVVIVVGLSIYGYSSLSWYGRIIMYDLVNFSEWPFRNGVEKHLLDNKEEFELVVNWYKNNPDRKDLKLSPIYELCSNYLESKSACDEYQNEKMKGVLEKIGLSMTWRSGEAIIFHVANETRNYTVFTIAITWQEKMKHQSCLGIDRLKKGHCNHAIDDRWSIYYLWFLNQPNKN